MMLLTQRKFQATPAFVGHLASYQIVQQFHTITENTIQCLNALGLRWRALGHGEFCTQYRKGPTRGQNAECKEVLLNCTNAILQA